MQGSLSFPVVLTSSVLGKKLGLGFHIEETWNTAKTEGSEIPSVHLPFYLSRKRLWVITGFLGIQKS